VTRIDAELLSVVREALRGEIRRQGIDHAEIARRMERERITVSQLLRGYKGRGGMTFATLAAFADALNLDVEIRLTPRSYADE
jgi:transcriptional regulator with XRE-family HTH domain